MPKEVYQSHQDPERTVTMEWEREMVTVPVALERGQFVPPLDPTRGTEGEKFCKAHFIFQGVGHLESVPYDSDEDPCDKVREWLKVLQHTTFTGRGLTPVRLGELLTRED